jgi:hypothetical protein
MSPNFLFLVPTAVSLRCKVGKQMISTCVVPTVKHGGGGVICGGALLVTLSVIYLEFKAHLTSMATTAFCNDTPSQRDNDPKHTSRLCKGYLTKRESAGLLHQMTWPPQSPNLNPIEMFWDELVRWVKEKQPTSAQHIWELLQDCWKIIPH